jgi:hypothetical protein
MPRSAELTVTELVAVLFPGVGSEVVELMVTDPAITVPPAVPASTLTTSVKVLNAAPAAVVRLTPSVQVTFPVPPTAGLVHVHPVAGVTETKVVFVGVACTHFGTAAEFGPALATTMV